MSKHRQLTYGQPIPQDFLDALQEFIGMGSRNLILTQIAANQIQITAGVGNAQVSLGIDGLWRFISTTVQTTVTGAAGTYSIFATCNSNSFSINPTPPPPEIDSTDYTFALTALLSGNPATPHFRKIGEAIFDGTRITNLRQLAGNFDGASIWQPGDIKSSAAQAPAAGWLLCDGSAVSRNNYPALYAALGGATSPWGQGDGSTTFNVPDFRSRTPIGTGQGAGLTSRVHGSYGGGTLDPSSPKRGEETHVLANGEMPVHSHGGGTGTDSPDHAHNINLNTGTESAAHSHSQSVANANVPVTQSGGQGAAVLGGTPPQTGTESALHVHNVSGGSSGATARHAHAISNDGGGTAHNTMPPWVACNWFVKT